jgi:hypothetical protein
MVAVAPALAGAICAATGRRLRALPLLPEGRLPDEEARDPKGWGPANGPS